MPGCRRPGVSSPSSPSFAILSQSCDYYSSPCLFDLKRKYKTVFKKVFGVEIHGFFRTSSRRIVRLPPAPSTISQLASTCGKCTLRHLSAATRQHPQKTRQLNTSFHPAFYFFDLFPGPPNSSQAPAAQQTCLNTSDRRRRLQYCQLQMSGLTRPLAVIIIICTKCYYLMN